MFTPMKKIFAVLFLAFVLAIPLSVGAIDLGADLVDRTAGQAGYSEATETSLAEIIGEGIKTALSFVGVIFLVLTVYAGFLWMNARGDQTQIEKAQDIIRGAIIGLIITVGAYSITAFIVPRIVERTSGEVEQNRGGGGDAGPRISCCQLCGVDSLFGCASGANSIELQETGVEAISVCSSLCNDSANCETSEVIQVPAGECR
jgi:hypothetical protein